VLDGSPWFGHVPSLPISFTIRTSGWGPDPWQPPWLPFLYQISRGLNSAGHESSHAGRRCFFTRWCVTFRRVPAEGPEQGGTYEEIEQRATDQTPKISLPRYRISCQVAAARTRDQGNAGTEAVISIGPAVLGSPSIICGVKPGFAFHQVQVWAIKRIPFREAMPASEMKPTSSLRSAIAR